MMGRSWEFETFWISSFVSHFEYTYLLLISRDTELLTQGVSNDSSYRSSDNEDQWSYAPSIHLILYERYFPTYAPGADGVTSLSWPRRHIPREGVFVLFR